MKSQQQLIVLAVLSAAALDRCAAMPAPLPPGDRLRRSARAAGESTGSGEGDAPGISTGRRSRRFLETDSVGIPQNCLALLRASANENGAIRKESYFVLTDGLSNGYYSLGNMTSYSDLPFPNKYAFVTLSCLCTKRQSANRNCCQGNRAHLDMSGLDAENPDSMEEETRYYVRDVCRTTSDAIGANVLEPTGEVAAVVPVTTTTTTASTTVASTATIISTTVTGSATISTTVTGSASIQEMEPGEGGDGGGDGEDSEDSEDSEGGNYAGYDVVIRTPISIIDEGSQDGVGIVSIASTGTSTKISTGAIVGAAVAGSLLFAMLASLLFLAYCKKNENRKQEYGVVLADTRSESDDESHRIAPQATGAYP